RGDRGSPNDLGEGPRRRPGDLALHDADARRDDPPFRQVPFLQFGRKRPRRGVVLARDLCRRPRGHAPHRMAPNPNAGRRSVSRIRPLAGGYTAFALLELVAIARYSGNVNWSAPAAWVYLAFLLSVLPVGLLTLFRPRWVEKN